MSRTVMRVIRRDGSAEPVSFDKVLTRIEGLATGLNVNVYDVAQKVCSRIFDGVRTTELDDLAATLCSSLIVEHPDYGTLASRITVSNHHKNTSSSFADTMALLYNNDTGIQLISRQLHEIAQRYRQTLDSHIDYARDYDYDYFGYKTLEHGYLARLGGRIVERPQHMLMRVALGIHGEDIEDALATYDLMSRRYFIHATPTLFNAGTNRPQNSSCYLVHMSDDSIDGIYDTLKDCAKISKYAGGIGMHIHNIRARSSIIYGTNGLSTGIIPMLRVFNATARYVNQSGKRNGSIAIFLEPWHYDIESFLDLRKNHGHEEERTRDLFLSLWVPDLFMERVRKGEMWSLMCPQACPGLSDVYGEEFERLYTDYEARGMYKKQVPAQDLWLKVLESQIEAGVPYIGYKDHVNRKSNQQNIGVIKSSNLCMEICEVSKPDEIAVCNLASICLPTYVTAAASASGKQSFDFDKLHEVVKVVTKNLNKVIDVNFYPVEKARVSNLRHRPIGIGVQGLADVFMLMRLPFDGEEARRLNMLIFETMYHAALEASMELSKKRAELIPSRPDLLNDMEQHMPGSRYPGAYTTFEGSPAQRGMLQFDLWGVPPASDRYDWAALKAEIQAHGLRNSLLIAPMPTASTSQIMGFTECFEPITSNLYKRKTLAGEFIIINKYLVRDLMDMGLWDTAMKQEIIAHDGSVQDIASIPEELKAIYKTVWEIKQKVIIDMAADRGAFVCQSQSMNIFYESPDVKRLTTMHFYAWQRGLKTGLYYLRSKPKAKAQKFTIDPELQLQVAATKAQAMAAQDKDKEKEKQGQQQVRCTDEICLSCSA